MPPRPDRRFSPAITAALLAGCAAAATPPAAAPVVGELAACFEAQNARLPFAGVAVAERDGQRFERAAGAIGPAGTAGPDAATRYRLASVGKVFTAVAIGQLVEQGRIDLDAPIGRYLPELPAAMAAATIEQLLHHRSGVASLTRVGPRLAPALARARTARELVPLVSAEPLAFAPGQRQQYSNGGYFLLGAAIEAVTGRVYADHLAEALFRPLGMTATSLEADGTTAVPMTRLAGPGQSPSDAPRPLPSPPRRGTPAGSAVSSGNDMIALGKALLGDRLLSPAVKARLFPRQSGDWRIGQGGGTMGANVDFAALPASGWVLVTLSNYDPPAASAMGEVLRGVVAGRGCHTLSAEDRPSPLSRPPERPGPSYASSKSSAFSTGPESWPLAAGSRSTSSMKAIGAASEARSPALTIRV